MGEATDAMRSQDDFRNSTVEARPTPRADGNSDQDTPGAAQIRSGIEQTRADLSETIDALQEKLDPARIAEQVKGQIREKATEAYDSAKNAVKEATIRGAGKIVSNVTETVGDVTARAGTAVRDSSSSVVQYIRDNPIPFALLGIGAGMLALNKHRGEERPYNFSRKTQIDTSGRSESNDLGTSNASFTDRARDLVSGVADTAREAAGNAADSTRRQFNQVSDQARQGAQVASDRFKNTLQENPMVVGVAALAAGALVGLALPGTRVETEYMGEARDRLVNQAKSVAHDAAEKVQRVTEEAGRTLKDAAQKEGLMVGQTGENTQT